MAAAFALAINSGNKIFYSQIEKICGFFRFAFSREGPSRETASVAAGSLRERPRSKDKDAVYHTGLLGESAFGAFRVCVAMKAPVGLLSGERSASADGGALPRQVPQSATNAKLKIKFPLKMARTKWRPFKMVCLTKEMPQMDKSCHLRHFGEKDGGGFDFLRVFM